MKTHSEPFIDKIAYKAVKEEIDGSIKVLEQSAHGSKCFVVKTANEWIDIAKKRPIPKMLFGVFWFEGEICILFADTNVGKSILGMQISESISKGLPITGFELEARSQKVIYLDFELSDKQFEKRYSNNYSDHYKFSNNFLRAEINPEMEIPKQFKSFEEFLIHSVVQILEDTKATILVVDNITYLRNDNEKAKDALPLMKELKSIGKKYGISILVLAHTPKRDSSKPLTKNDLAGSKMLINFCDSAFAIGESASDSSLRYLKQIKQRNTGCVYNEENVVVCEILQDHNFLKFQLVDFDSEANHLGRASSPNHAVRNEEIIGLHKKGVPNTQIAAQYGLSEGGIRKILNKNEPVDS
ncbi:AAA family ATPase [Psychroserpens sp. Hel_I_66]|uniref:AAA family ATPase n=1 Tax=Psychroserpens sp. Hel_I_66 TaxID=1250004 RepID=UPI0009DD1BD7|nr:AAA family ATPase [Psychroserpens sp. Hel_I_66]